MVLVLFVLRAVRNHLRGSVFPDWPPREVRFRERNASGRSFRSIFTRLGGASNCVEVTVTEDELWTRLGMWPFNLLFTGDEFGMENRIPLASILTVTRLRWRRRRFLIEYRTASGQTGRLELAVRDADAFAEALRAGDPLVFASHS